MFAALLLDKLWGDLTPGDRLYIPASNSPENFFQLGKTLMCKLSSILSLFYTWGG